MKRLAIPGVVLALAVVIACIGSSTLKSEEGKGAKNKDQDTAADRAPPGIRKGVKVQVHYSGRADETWVVKEVKGKWVKIDFEGNEYWANFDMVVYYSFKK